MPQIMHCSIIATVFYYRYCLLVSPLSSGIASTYLTSPLYWPGLWNIFVLGIHSITQLYLPRAQELSGLAKLLSLLALECGLVTFEFAMLCMPLATTYLLPSLNDAVNHRLCMDLEWERLTSLSFTCFIQLLAPLITPGIMTEPDQCIIFGSAAATLILDQEHPSRRQHRYSPYRRCRRERFQLSQRSGGGVRWP
ncbi:hypothetical protein V8C35DRAFT_112369 [Trichoderma chlorosporum]